MEQTLKKALKERKNISLYRTRTVRQSSLGSEVFYKDKKYISFFSNDYLGLSNHPQVVESFKNGVERYGVGSGASQTISGYSMAHQALEEELADFMGYERALLFSTGYMANLGVLTTLLGRFDTLYQDKLNHA